MKTIKIIIAVVFFIFLIDGCHTHLHFSHTLSPKMEVNPKPKDTIYKKDTIVIKK